LDKFSLCHTPIILVGFLGFDVDLVVRCVTTWSWNSRQKVVGVYGIFWLSKTSFGRVVGIFMMSLPIGAVHNVDGGAICRQLCFFFFLAFLSLPPQHSDRSFKISELSSYLFIFQLWSLFFWFLVFIIGLFVKF